MTCKMRLIHVLYFSYIILSTFGQNSTKLIKQNDHIRLIRNAFFSKQNSSERYALRGKEKQSKKTSENPVRPRFTLSRSSSIQFKPENYFCIEHDNIECKNKTKIFREKVLNELKKVNLEKIEEPNIYNVEYSSKNKTSNNAVCSILLTNVRALKRKDLRNFPISQYIQKKKLFSKKKVHASCAVITSAGALINSKLGKFIDLHDIVMRFNNAPVEGHSIDVGSKTTIRIVNSQVVSKPEFNFLNSKMFKNISIGAWDSGKFNGTLEDWLDSPDFDLFSNYQKFMINDPTANFYLIDPRSIWRLWQTLQDHSNNIIRSNPPSSGFIGIALLFPMCKYIDIIEYIPSTRFNGKCYYYSDELNSACTFGVWHPLASEKLMAYDMNSSDDFTVFQKGIMRIKIPAKEQCH